MHRCNRRFGPQATGECERPGRPRRLPARLHDPVGQAPSLVGTQPERFERRIEYDAGRAGDSTRYHRIARPVKPAQKLRQPPAPGSDFLRNAEPDHLPDTVLGKDRDAVLAVQHGQSAR